MRAWALPSFLLLCSACGASADAASSGPATGGAGGTGSGGTAEAGEAGAARPDSLEFETVDDLVARQAVTLRVRARPVGAYHLRFALPLNADDAPLDAVLGSTEADTDADGIASVQLVAPSSKTRFAVRASAAENVSARLELQVIDTGFAQLQVSPRYSSAVRFPTTWIATAHPNTACTELDGIPPPDGTIVSAPAGPNESPLLAEVPAQTPLAVTLRSGHFVGGCASVSGLMPDEKAVVTVAVLNRPIDLGASRLSLKLDLAEGDAAWAPLLAAASESALAALIGTSVDDVDALLDSMREAAGSERQLFETTRQTEDWDSLVRAQLGAQASNRLRAVVGNWLRQAQKDFFASRRLLEGTVEPDAENSSSAHLSLLSVGSVGAEQAGFASPALWSWSASPDDNVTMGTDIYLFESKLLTALAEQTAIALSSDAVDAPEALAEAVDCTGLGSQLAAAGASAAAYTGCDASCLTRLCELGLRSIWLRAGAATALTPSRLTLTATAEAFPGDAAEVAGMSGAWLGQLQGPSGAAAPTRGTLTAASKP